MSLPPRCAAIAIKPGTTINHRQTVKYLNRWVALAVELENELSLRSETRQRHDEHCQHPKLMSQERSTTPKQREGINLAEAKRQIREKIAEIKADSRFKAKPALVQVNAPLALIQVEMHAQVYSLTYALDLLRQVRK